MNPTIDNMGEQSDKDKEVMERAFNQVARKFGVADVDSHQLPGMVLTRAVQSRGHVSLGCDRI